MKKFIYMFVATIFLIVGHLNAASNAVNDSVVGTIIGGVIGGVIGHQSGERDAGIAVGAATGAVIGYAHGNERDKSAVYYGNRSSYPPERVVYVERAPRREVVVYREVYRERDRGFTCRPPAPVYRPVRVCRPVRTVRVYRPEPVIVIDVEINTRHHRW